MASTPFNTADVILFSKEHNANATLIMSCDFDRHIAMLSL